MIATNFWNACKELHLLGSVMTKRKKKMWTTDLFKEKRRLLDI